MARAAWSLSSLLLVAVCSSNCGGVAAGPTAAAPLAIEPGHPFVLKPGQQAVAAGADGLRIGFDGVAADSRCPKGEQCVWAGDATVRVWLQARGAPREHVELHTAPGRLRSVVSAGHTLQLLDLRPWPVSGRAIAAPDYAAQLLLDPTAAGDDRLAEVAPGRRPL